MRKIYLDMTENDGISIFVSDAEVIPAGTTVYSMSVKHRSAEYEKLALEYDVHFIFDDCRVSVDFYTVPRVDIWATDSKGGYFGTIGEMCDLESDAPICYIDREKNVFLAAENFRAFNKKIACWRQNLTPYEGITFYDSKEAAMKELEFVEVPQFNEDTN